MNDDVRAQWLGQLGNLPVEAEALFPETTGFFLKRRNKKRAELLEKIEPVLARALQPGERIRYAARGMRYIWWEYYLTGIAVAQYTNMQALVLTDRRLLMIHVGSRGKPGDIKNAVALGDVRKVHKKLGARVVLELADGKKLDFIGLAKDAPVLAAMIPATPGPKTAERSLQHLCPECVQPANFVPDGDGACSNGACQIPFRSARRAARMSLLMPGLGDLYLRHNLFGTLELLGSTVALMLGIFMFLVGAGADFEGPGAIGLAAIGLLLLVVPRALDYGLTLHMGRKGIVPLASRPAGSTGIALLPFFPRWAYPMFVVIALGVAGGTASMIPAAKTEAQMNLATEAARAGDFALAMQRYEAANSFGEPQDNSLASLAAALFEAGDVEDGHAIVARIHGRPVEAADRINTLRARIDADHEAYEAARARLVGADDVDGAFQTLDVAMARMQWIQKPKYPASRDEVVLSLVRDLFVQGDPASLGSAEDLLPLVTAPEHAPHVAVARAHLAALSEDLPAAYEELEKLGQAKIEGDWAYFNLETRTLVSAKEEFPALLAEAEKLSVGLDLEQRRSDLLNALRGRPGAEVAGDVP